VRGRGSIVNIVWTPAGVYLAVGLGFWLLGLAALAFVLRRKGKTRTLTQEELAQSINNRMNDPFEPTGVAWGVGVQRESSMNIGELRELAKRGGWAVFWTWPFVFLGFGFGMLGLSAATSSFFREPVLLIIGAVVCVPFGLIGFFCAWAALYTKLE
jgi:hypothetical protein